MSGQNEKLALALLPKRTSADIDKYLSKDKIDTVYVFVLERRSGKLGGLLELNVRNCAEGVNP